MNLEKIVSGGQTGVDQGALDAALAAGFPCGGWCPPGRLSEAGTIPDIYPVTELTGGGYSRRTIQNILDSDGTAIIHFGEIEGGTEFTLMQCIKKKRPYRLIDGEEVMPARAGELLAAFVSAHDIRVLNMAGPRASKCPKAEKYTCDVIGALLGHVPGRQGARR
jgi:hypothetical protein